MGLLSLCTRMTQFLIINLSVDIYLTGSGSFLLENSDQGTAFLIKVWFAASSTFVIWELIRNADSQAPPLQF